MFANEFQGGAHVEVLGTQGQNPLAQWKVSGPQKGVQKVYDKALKGYVFVSSGACRLMLPKDDRTALGLIQPHLLLQLEVGVGTPFSVEVGLSDASATRRRIILSSSFSELKCTPLHCQVPFTCLPRECWLNLVLPLADLAAVLFKGTGGSSSGAGGGAAAGAAAAAAAAAGSSLSAAAAAASMSYRTLDSLQLAGTCRLRRICTLREVPQPTEAADGGGAGAAAPAKPLEFPAGLDHQTLLLDPRSISLVGINTGTGSLSQIVSPGASGGGGGLGVVGTSTGSSRRPANGGTTSPLPGVNGTIRTSPSAGIGHGAAAKCGGGGNGAAAAAAAGEDDAVDGSGAAAAVPVASAVSHQVGGDTPTRGSSSGVSTPTTRTGSAVPTLPPAFGASRGASGDHHHHHHHRGSTGDDHIATPSRLGRSPSGGFGASNGATSPPPPPGSGSGPGSACGSGPLPALDSAPSLGTCSCSSAGGGGSGLKLPRVQCGNGGGAAAATTTTSPSGEESGRGDGSPFGSRRALSAQTPPRQCGGATPPGSAGGTGSVSGGAAAGAPSASGGAGRGAGSGKPPTPPWSGGSSTSKRAQSGPARISTEALSQGLGDTMAPADTPMSPSLVPRQSQSRRTQNNSHIPPTISEHDPATPPSSGGAGTPAAKSPARSPSRTRQQPSTSVISVVSAAAPPAGASATAAAAPPPSASNAVGAPLRPGGGSGGVGDPAPPSLPQLRHARAEAVAAAARDHPASPAVSAVGASSSNNPFSQLSSVLTIRGGMEASIDFGAQSHLLDGSPGSSSILSSNLRISSVTGHTHRYGGGGAAAATNGGGTAAAAAPSASVDAPSDSDTEPVPSPSGGAVVAATAAATAIVTVTAAPPPPTTDPVKAKVSRIRTRVLPGGGAAGGVPNSPSLSTRKGTGQGSDVDTPTRAGRSGIVSTLSQNGRNSPASTPSRAGGGGSGGQMTPVPGGGGGSSGAGPGPSSLGPNVNGGRQRKDDGAAGGRPPAPTAAATGGAGGAGGTTAAGGGRGPAAGGGGGGAATPKQSGNGAPSVCSSPARQRPTAPSSATRGSARPGPSGATADNVRDRLPPLAAGSGGAGRGRGGGAGAGRAGGGGGAAAYAAGRINPAAGRGMRPKRPTTSNEVDVEESITLNAGLWGGFGVDEDDDMLGSRHFRSGGMGGSSCSDGELGGGGVNGMLPSTPSLRGGIGGGAGGGAGSLVRRASRSSSPGDPGGGMAEELPSPPDHFGNAAGANGLPSPPIRRASDAAADVGPVFAGFQAPADRRRSSCAGGGGGAAAADGAAAAAAPARSNSVLDSLLDEEALLAGHVRDLDHYDDWAKVDQRSTPLDLLHPHRAFTPPVVPASKSLGVGLAGGRASGGKSSGGAVDPRVLRLSGAPAAAAARGQGVVVAAGGEAMLDLVYDPVLNCYYDVATGQYYELKT